MNKYKWICLDKTKKLFKKTVLNTGVVRETFPAIFGYGAWKNYSIAQQDDLIKDRKKEFAKIIKYIEAKKSSILGA